MYTENFSEANAPLAAFGATAATTEQNSGYVNMAKYHRLAIVIYNLQTTTTFDVDIEITTDGVSAGLWTLKSAAQIGSGGDDVILCIEVRADELGKPSGAPSGNYDWVNVEITPVGAAAFTCIVFGLDPRYAPVPSTLWEQVVS